VDISREQAAVKYETPTDWIRYEVSQLAMELVEARAAVAALQAVPYQRSWLDALQRVELKREVAGTSKIEGAEFTDKELEVALQETPEQLLTRSQRQAHAAVRTYRWIAELPFDHPLDDSLIREIHRHIVSGADDDHCAPATLRSTGENVTFGVPRHRGCEGGDPCGHAFSRLAHAIGHEFKAHDPIIQALAAHYHLAAMHPFLDGNGRTARALEALLLRRAGLHDTAFIAMSNYYYEEKAGYLTALAAVRAAAYDLTPFLRFALKGVALQSTRMLDAMRAEMKKALFKNMMFELFNRLKSPKRRVIAERQLAILKLLLDGGPTTAKAVIDASANHYSDLKTPRKTIYRDLNELIHLGALRHRRIGGTDPTNAPERIELSVDLDWPSKITETDFFRRLKALPKGKTYDFLS
jgi:Fic family protein